MIFTGQSSRAHFFHPASHVDTIACDDAALICYRNSAGTFLCLFFSFFFKLFSRSLPPLTLAVLRLSRSPLVHSDSTPHTCETFEK